MSYTLAADIYLGDVSSQIWEFLIQPRPCVFANVHKVSWREDPNYLHWHTGMVFDDIANLDGVLSDAISRHHDHRECQEALFRETFAMGNDTASRRGAKAILEYLSQATRAKSGDRAPSPGGFHQLDTAPGGLVGLPQVDGVPEVRPEFREISEQARRPDSHLRAEGAMLPEQFIEPRLGSFVATRSIKCADLITSGTDGDNCYGHAWHRRVIEEIKPLQNDHVGDYTDHHGDTPLLEKCSHPARRIHRPLLKASALIAVVFVIAALSFPAILQENDEVSLDRIPAGVTQTILAAVPGITILNAETDYVNGSLVYEVNGATADHNYEIEVTPDSTILEIEKMGLNVREERIALHMVDEVVMAAAYRSLPGFDLLEAEIEHVNDTLIYELEGTINGKSYEIELTAEGAVIEIEEEPSIHLGRRVSSLYASIRRQYL